MKIDSGFFRIREGDEVDLKKHPTMVAPVFESKSQYKKMLKEHVAQLSARQELLYASNRYAILLIFQAMDAAGKDGAIKHVMSGVNPQGCQVFSFQHPSAAELEHDFLWRTTRDMCSGLICPDTSIGGQSTIRGVLHEKAAPQFRHQL